MCRAETLFALEMLMVRAEFVGNSWLARWRLGKLEDEQVCRNGMGRKSAGGKIEDV